MGDIDLLMIGKTGNGKSALGNTILRRKAFESKSKTTSVTTSAQYEISEFNGRVIKVVDGPGVGDNRMDTEKAKKLFVNAMASAIAANTKGYHAFLLVVKFGGRFTAEDNETIAFLKQIFGKSFVRDFCILVLTYGDCFEIESKETGILFPDWCLEQEGVFHELLMECNRRVIMFDNVTKDEEKIVRQINDLIQIVDNLNSTGHRYTDVNFETARKERERIIIEAKTPIIRDETMTETRLIIQKLQRILDITNPEKCKGDLEELLTRTKLLYNSIKTQNNGTGALRELVEIVNSLKKMIQDELMSPICDAHEKEEMKRLHAERQRCRDETMEHEEKLYELEAINLLEKEKTEPEQLEYWERSRIRRIKIIKGIEKLEKEYQEVKKKHEDTFFVRIVYAVHVFLMRFELTSSVI